MEKNQEYMRRIMITINYINGLYATGAKWMGEKANTLTLIYALEDGKTHTQKSICDDWLIPRTTINTIIKECKNRGYIELKQISGKRRELEICLTENGKKFANKLLYQVHQAEEKAMKETQKEIDDKFIDGMELFCNNLKKAFEEVED